MTGECGDDSKTDNRIFVKAMIKGSLTDIEVSEIRPGVYLEPSAAKDFLAMEEAAILDGLGPFKVNTAWRSYEWQKRAYDVYEAEMQAQAKMPLSKRRALAPVAKPGKSKHEIGKAVDINRAPGDDPKTKAYDSPTDLWLAKNAAKFNFYATVVREPWHWEHKK